MSDLTPLFKSYSFVMSLLPFSSLHTFLSPVSLPSVFPSYLFVYFLSFFCLFPFLCPKFLPSFSHFCTSFYHSLCPPPLYPTFLVSIPPSILLFFLESNLPLFLDPPFVISTGLCSGCVCVCFTSSIARYDRQVTLNSCSPSRPIRRSLSGVCSPEADARSFSHTITTRERTQIQPNTK
ncbi:hypothetical protein ATANTOWER_009379 [Ataeniobius toweri]|uniref:Uncharacterized protein n=1 Tax=Ataeniobius toweri TaxID=208326 RepID=A0ABU7C9V6_9TELE|nr:hypothetical protein [Ataeniobius toweri]